MKTHFNFFISRAANVKLLLPFVVILAFVQGCLPPPVKLKVSEYETEQLSPIQENIEQKEDLPTVDFETSRFRRRDPIPLEKYRYEGSLWGGESSWGNLMRDHRARYRGDVLIVKQIKEVFKGNLNYQNDPEAQEVLSNIDDLSVRIVRTFDNGTLAIYGEKVDYRNNNNTRYQTVLKGIVRINDIDDNNEVLSSKIARFELSTEKKIKFDPNKLRFTAKNSQLPQRQ